MEKNSVLNGNKLIAEFMEYRYIGYSPDSSYKAGWWRVDTPERVITKGNAMKMGDSRFFLCRRHPELRYWNSWDWLMPVIHKISNLGYTTNSKLHYKVLDIDENYIIESREAMFTQVVEFIEWYNENIKQNMKKET